MRRCTGRELPSWVMKNEKISLSKRKVRKVVLCWQKQYKQTPTKFIYVLILKFIPKILVSMSITNSKNYHLNGYQISHTFPLSIHLQLSLSLDDSSNLSILVKTIGVSLKYSVSSYIQCLRRSSLPPQVILGLAFLSCKERRVTVLHCIENI